MGAHTEETIKESVREIAESGFAGIEFAMLNAPGVNPSIWSYGSQEWVNDVRLIIQEATKYGLSASFTSGTHWATANIPGLSGDDQAANQDVANARALVTQGNTLTTVPVPTIQAGRNQTFVSAVAYKLAGPNVPNPNIRHPLLLDHTSAVDLTEDIENGTLNFTAEDGNYMVFSFWQRGTWQTSSPAVAPARTINYFDRRGFEALKAYWESYLFADQELVETIRENGKVQMFMDSLEYSNSQGGAFGNTSMFWTEDMKDEFFDIKGYDITPYLPVVIGAPSMFAVEQPKTGTVGFSGEEGRQLWDKVVADLRDVQTQLYMKNLMVPLRQWLNEEYDIKLRAQISYGRHLEISQPITVVDYPETETRNQRDQTDIYRVWAGGANLLNKVLSSETAAHDMMNYGYSLQEYLQQNYTQYAGGVNRVIWHGYASKWGPQQSVRWPGYEAGMNAICCRFGDRNPSFKDYNEYNDHLGRLQTVLQAGVAQLDLAILYTDYAYQLPKRSFVPAETLQDLKQQKHEGWQWADLTLQDHGYTYNYFGPHYLDGGYATYDKDSGLLAADGPAYQALLLYQDTIPLSSAEIVLDMARDGLKVVMVEGAWETTTYNDGNDAELADVKQELIALDNVRYMEDKASALAALEDLGVYPRVGYGTPDQELLSLTRKDDDAIYLFLYNYYNVIRGWDEEFTTFDKNASWDSDIVTNAVEVDGIVKPYILDTWTGEISEVATYSYRAGKTVVPIEIPDGDVRVYIFKDVAEEPGLHVTTTDASSVFMADRTVTARNTSSGSYFVEFSDGTSFSSSSSVPAPRTLTDWAVTVESWTVGPLSEPRSETTPLGNYTEEYTYLTDKNEISLELENLTPWNILEEVGRDVSGIGTYRTTFDWDTSTASGAYLDLGPIVESVTVFVNGTKTSDVNLNDDVVEIPNSLLVDGDNTLKIIVTTPLANTMLSIGYNGANLSEGPYFDNQSQNRLLDHVYTYFDHGLPQAELTPYVDMRITLVPGFECTDTITGQHVGPLTISTGVTCIEEGSSVEGPVTVRPGGGLAAEGVRFTGPVTAKGASIVYVCGSEFTGPLDVTGGSGVMIGDVATGCEGNRVTGTVSVVGTNGPSVIGGNQITGRLACSGNSPAPVNNGFPNTVMGPRTGQCSGL